MSIQIERQKPHAPITSLACWRCDGPMMVKTIEPSMLSDSLDDIVYRCPACRLERKQSGMRAD
jgi:hypothetical protein